ncbi:hypothetical protein [Chloroflexus sp.]|uniref:hypothetical protein n=1 Tax=Chloroflexus sp. TaxID=1904827 RepID=UPI002ACE6901|nr:hypothetical protein [Chloroflexus sp.]
MKQHYFHHYGVRFAGWYLLLALCWLIAVHLWLEHVLVASPWLRLAVDVGFIAISALFASVMVGQLWRQIDVQLGLSRLSNRLHQLALNAPPSPYFEAAQAALQQSEARFHRLAEQARADASI